MGEGCEIRRCVERFNRVRLATYNPMSATSSSDSDAQSSNDDSDYTGSTEPKQPKRVLGRVLAGTRHSYYEGEEGNSRKFVVTPLGQSVGKAIVAGFVVGIDQTSPGRGRIKIDDGSGFTFYANVNHHTDVSLEELRSFDLAEPVIITGTPDTYTPTDDDGNDLDMTRFSFDIERINSASETAVQNWRAEAASNAVEQAQDLVADLDSGDFSTLTSVWMAIYEREQVEDLFEHATDVAGDAADALREINENGRLESELSEAGINSRAIEHIVDAAESVEDLISHMDDELLDIHQVGPATVETIREEFGHLVETAEQEDSA